MRRPDRDSFRFRFAATDQSVREYEINCVSFLNAVYGDAGLPPPFVRAAPRKDDAWARFARAAMGYDYSRQPAPADILDRPDFRVIAEGWNPSEDPRRIAAMDALADFVRDLALDGWRFRRPRFAARLLVRVAGRYSRHLDTTAEMAETRATLLDFAHRVEIALTDHLRRNRNTSEEQTARLMREFGLRLRDRYFERPTNPAPDSP